MNKNFQYLFLVSLLGCVSMAASKPNTETFDRQAKKEVSSKNIDISGITFSQDIKNHPVLWIVVSAALNFVAVVLVTVASLENETIQPLPYSVGYIIVLFSYALLSLLTASWTSLWSHEGQKGEDPIIPPWENRFWRSFRFLAALSLSFFSVLFPTFVIEGKFGRTVFLVSPFIGAILSYVGIRFYDYWQGQKEETKVINKKDPVLDPQDKSLDVMKPLVA